MIVNIYFSQQSIVAVKEVTSVIGFRDHLEVSSLSVSIETNHTTTTTYQYYLTISILPYHIINATLTYNLPFLTTYHSYMIPDLLWT
jgi:Zn finger protein HypA/HybF involved in hydrogenase expression